MYIKFGRFIYSREGHGILGRVQGILILFFERVTFFSLLTRKSPFPTAPSLFVNFWQVPKKGCLSVSRPYLKYPGGMGMFRWLGSQYFTTVLPMYTIGSHFEDGPEKGPHILVVAEGRGIFEIREQAQ